VTISVPDTNTINPIRINVTSAGTAIARVSGINFTGAVVTGDYASYCHGGPGGFVAETKSNIAQFRIDNNRFSATNTNYMARRCCSMFSYLRAS